MRKKQQTPFGTRLIGNLEGGLDDLKRGRSLRKTFVALPPPPPEFDRSELVDLRRELGMTQTALAAFLNVSEKTVESWEQGARRPGGSALRLLQVIRHPEILGSARAGVRRRRNPAGTGATSTG